MAFSFLLLKSSAILLEVWQTVITRCIRMFKMTYLLKTQCIWVFGVSNYESDVGLSNSKMADPIWRRWITEFSRIRMKFREREHDTSLILNLILKLKKEIPNFREPFIPPSPLKSFYSNLTKTAENTTKKYLIYRWVPTYNFLEGTWKIEKGWTHSRSRDINYSKWFNYISRL